MKWLTHKSGDVRDRVVFAWKPKKCADGFTRRFVFLNVREVYSESIYRGEDKGYSEGWVANRWTPLKSDPVAEAAAAVAQVVRDSRPLPKVGFISINLSGGLFGNTPIDGDEWKNKSDDSDEDDG